MKNGVVALNTLPAMNARLEKAEAELVDLLYAMRTFSATELHMPREEFGGANYAQTIKEKRLKCEALPEVKEFIEIKTSLREIVRKLADAPSDTLHGKSFSDAIKAKKDFIKTMNIEIRNRMRTPNQLVFDFDGDLFGDIFDGNDGEEMSGS